MKHLKPDKDGRCVCFAHNEDECQCGAWDKSLPMRWHKLADERPTEDVEYLTASGRMYKIRSIDDLKNWQGWGVTHWTLITPPEREEGK